jgi:hypothetical protein
MAKSKETIDYNVNINTDTKDLDKLNSSLSKTDKAVDDVEQSIDKLDNSTKSLKVQLKEATLEQQKLSAAFGSTSKEAIAAAKNVAKVKDEMEFQKDLVKSYNPDEKFRNLSQTAGVAALALGGVKDGFTALGIESKILDKIIGSAQAILGVTSAVSGLSDAYEVLTASQRAKSAANLTEATTAEVAAVAETEAAAATWSWNAALLANPIVAITAGIVAAGAAIYAYVKITGDAVKEEEKAKVASWQLSMAIDNQAKSFERNNKFLQANNDHKIALLRASGASEAQIYAETRALAEQEIQLAKNYEAEALRLEQKAHEAERDNPTEFTKQTAKIAKENAVKARAAVELAFDGLIKAQQDHEVALAQAKTDARKKAEDDEDKAAEERKKKKEEKRKKDLQDAKDLAKSELQADLDTKKEIQDSQDAINKEREDVEKEDTARRLEELKEAADREVEIEQMKADQKQAIQDGQINAAEKLVGFLYAIAGKNKTLQKAAIIAESALGIGRSVIATNASNVTATAEGAALAIPTAGASVAAAASLVTANYIALGLGTAANVAATAKALQAVGGGSAPGVGSQGTRGSNGGTSVSNISNPQIGFQNSPENQISRSIAQANQSIKVNVLASDITDTQKDLSTNVVQNSF